MRPLERKHPEKGKSFERAKHCILLRASPASFCLLRASWAPHSCLPSRLCAQQISTPACVLASIDLLVGSSHFISICQNLYDLVALLLHAAFPDFFFQEGYSDYHLLTPVAPVFYTSCDHHLGSVPGCWLEHPNTLAVPWPGSAMSVKSAPP